MRSQTRKATAAMTAPAIHWSEYDRKIRAMMKNKANSTLSQGVVIDG